MSDADRVFSRHQQPTAAPASQSRQLIVSASRRNSAGIAKSRVVEVVHVSRAGSRQPADEARPVPRHVHAETWPDGFHAKSAAPLPPRELQPAAPEPAAPVGHVMPGWQPLLQPAAPEADPVAAPAAAPTVRQRTPRAAKPPTPTAASRPFADPFTGEDSGANCYRCGYLVEPAREARGLTTCAKCG